MLSVITTDSLGIMICGRYTCDHFIHANAPYIASVLFFFSHLHHIFITTSLLADILLAVLCPPFYFILIVVFLLWLLWHLWPTFRFYPNYESADFPPPPQKWLHWHERCTMSWKEWWAQNFTSHHIAFRRHRRPKTPRWRPKNSTFFKSGQIFRVDWN